MISVSNSSPLQAQWSVFEANARHAAALRLQSAAVKASVDELRQRKSDLVACFADVAASVDGGGSESTLLRLQQLARDAADSDCMRGLDVSEAQQNYASKLLLAAINDMREAVPGPLRAIAGT
jgi:hypothetical protein